MSKIITAKLGMLILAGQVFGQTEEGISLAARRQSSRGRLSSSGRRSHGSSIWRRKSGSPRTKVVPSSCG